MSSVFFQSNIFLSILLISSAVFADGLADKFTYKGDFRFRTENIKEEQAAPTPEAERTRQRLRLRLNLNAKINASTEVLTRFSSGSTAPSEANSTNQDFTDYYSKKSILIDLAYFNWKASDETSIWGGKTPLVFDFAGGNDMLFDSDLTPEGLALKYKKTVEQNEYYFNTSATWLSERYSATGATDNTDVGLIGGQVGINHKDDDYSCGINLASYNFSNVKGATAPSAKGNSLVAGVYTYDYKVTSVGVEFAKKFSETPVTFYAESARNSDGGDYNTAAIYGVKIGKLKDVSSWAFVVDSREIKKDATIGVFTESDSSGGGADINSLKVSGSYQWSENSNVALTLFTGKKTISSATLSPNYQRLMADFNFNF